MAQSFHVHVLRLLCAWFQVSSIPTSLHNVSTDLVGSCRGFELPARCKRLHAWYALVTQRPSVQATLKGPDKQDFESALLEHYSKYAPPLHQIALYCVRFVHTYIARL